MGTATNALSPVLEALLRAVVVGDLPALGLSWLAAYVLGNGSVIAALALSLFDAGLVNHSQLFLMVVGSRLGAAAIGYVVVPWFRPLFPEIDAGTVGVRSPALIEPIATALTRQLGAGVVFLAAIGLFLVSLKLFDRVLERVDTEWLRENYLARLERHWTSFGLGVLVTDATTSVAFSLGIVVPIYNRGYIKRREITPYVLGANIGTLVDTLIVAVVLGAPDGVAIVFLVLALSTLVTVGLLLGFPRYYAVVDGVQSRLIADRRFYIGVLVLLAVVPLALIFVH